MIDSIYIADIATFTGAPEVFSDLSSFNYIFGANGTGKTTVSRVIADEEAFPTCKVTWTGGTKLQPRVYNRDFVEKNFEQSANLKGVFTLGEKNVDILNRIAAAKTELDALIKRIQTLTYSLQGEDGAGGKKGELATLQAELKDKCWAQKQKHDAKLSGAFEGFRGSSEKFMGKVLQEGTSNSAILVSLAELEKRAETIFGSTPITEQSLQTIKTAPVVSHEANPILKKRVLGNEDVDIAAMIKKLNNNDWVRAGRTFYDANDRTCPFCQQTTAEAFAQSLNEYFDATFESDSKEIDDLEMNYAADCERLRAQIASIIAIPGKFIDVEKLKVEKTLLDSKIGKNLQLIASKKKEPSQVVEFESVSNVVEAIKRLIDSANTLVAEHNEMVANLSQERREITEQVWKYLLEDELKVDLIAYKTRRDGLDKAIEDLNNKITKTTADKVRKDHEIQKLEKRTTSVQPTIDEINTILSSFGFDSFSLSITEKGTSYKLVRPDGSDAKATLSEGERNFVTFLYFYHLLKGSDTESGMTNDRVVVFDDPVSSLDSDILFIVCSLIKGLFGEVRSDTGHIKQIFVLTHNVYFHKEVTFNPNRKNISMNEETFWIIRKVGAKSKAEKHTSNPITTSYDLLWAEIRKSDRSSLTIQNTLRRILENYFKILGGIDPEKICEMFESKEKLICKSLFSWVHDGSHYAHDDLYVSIDDTMVETYLKVFREIFDKSNHAAHYRMMMKDAYAEDSTKSLPD